jgi:hypothetical protein
MSKVLGFIVVLCSFLSVSSHSETRVRFQDSLIFVGLDSSDSEVFYNALKFPSYETERGLAKAFISADRDIQLHCLRDESKDILKPKYACTFIGRNRSTVPDSSFALVIPLNSNAESNRLYDYFEGPEKSYGYAQVKFLQTEDQRFEIFCRRTLDSNPPKADCSFSIQEIR